MKRTDLQDLYERASRLFQQNLMCVDGRRYHAPSIGRWEERRGRSWPQGWVWGLAWGLAAPFVVRYPHQWFWDSCAHAIVLSYVDAAQAWEEVRSLLALQRKDGFIPHMAWNRRWRHWRDFPIAFLYGNTLGSPYLQPPNLARAVELVSERTGREDELRRVLPGVAAYYDYLDSSRNVDGDGLLVIVHPYESGRDRSPEFDQVLGASMAHSAWPLLRLVIRHWRAGWRWPAILSRGDFVVKEVLFNCVYARSLASLARLETQMGNHDEAEKFRCRARRTEASIREKMYDEVAGLAWSLDRGREELPVAVRTVACLMPLLLENLGEAEVARLLDHLSDPEEFWIPYPVPAALQHTGRSSAHAIWRGPQTWLYTNWLLVDGLCSQAERFPAMRPKLLGTARQIAEKSYALVYREGFREYYDSYTGKGKGAKDMGWSALALDMLVRTAGDA